MLAALASAVVLLLPTSQSSVADRLREAGLKELGAYAMLQDLCTTVGHRLSGSPQSEKAIEWAEREMGKIGLANMRRIECMVPHWVRGKPEKAVLIEGSRRTTLNVLALGGSVATPKGGLEAEVVEVHSLEEAEGLGERGEGKIVFYNRAFDASLANTFAAYGGAVNQRTQGASAAAKVGAVGVLVRSMTLASDDEPHTGAMRYADGIAKIPAAALGIASANRLSEALKKNPKVKVRLEMFCETLPDAPSASPIGEIIGSEKPNEVIVLGGHLDSWDVGQGAHDDGAGCVQALEALRLIRTLGIRPKRTIRAVMFMNEENGLRGALAYRDWAKANQDRGEISYAAIESDSGGFMPRAFGVTEAKLEAARRWLPVLESFGIERFVAGGADADIAPLAPLGTTLFSLEPENQRYFDYHHSRNDTIDKVNPRELEMGALAMAVLAMMLSEEGI